MSVPPDDGASCEDGASRGDGASREDGASPEDVWTGVRRFTPARVALGRAGSALPTREVLRFALAHAEARDAVRLPLDVAALETAIRAEGFATARIASAAPDRTTYLARPDLGRRLADESRTAVAALGAAPVDLALVVADGLSAPAVASHAVPVLTAIRPWLEAAGLSFGPVLIAGQARVALGDEAGARLGARAVLVLIGERPGLSAPDSLGAYLTFAPRVGRSDAERNCVSNIRPAGLSYDLAAYKLAWLLDQALTRQLTGVTLKDESDDRLLDGRPPTPILPSPKDKKLET